MQIVILGMHRSGTSAVTRILNLMGAYVGPEGMLLGAAPDNPKGHWERLDVLRLNEELLQAVETDWHQIANFKITNIPAKAIETFESEAEKILLKLDSHRPWVIKDPRLCLLFPFWRRLLEVPVCLHVHRSPIQIAQSLQTHHRLPLPVGMALWEKYTLSALEASAGLPRTLISYKALIDRPVATVKQLYDEMVVSGVQGLRLPEENEITAFISKKLFRERGNNALQDEFITRKQARLVKALEKKEILNTDVLPAISQSSLEILADHEKHLREFKALHTHIQAHHADKEALHQTLARQATVLHQSHLRQQELENKIHHQETEFAHLNRHLAQQAVRYQTREDHYNQRLQELRQQARRQRDKVVSLNHSLQEQATQLQMHSQHNKELEKKIKEQADEISAKTQQIFALQDEIQYKSEDVRKLTEFTEKLNVAIQAIFSSLTWRTGYFAAELIRKATFRHKEPLIQDHIQNLRSRFSSWKKNYFQQQKTNDSAPFTGYIEKKIKIAALVTTRGDGEPSGSAYIRLIRPLQHPKIKNRISFSICRFWEELLSLEVDIVIIQRSALPDLESMQKLITHCRENDIKLVYEIDDDLFAASKKKEVKIFYSKAVQESIRLIIEKSDRIITSSPPLQKQLKRINPNVSCLPNALDETLWLEKGGNKFIKPHHQSNDNCIRILYMGTRTHGEDLKIVEKAYKKIKGEYGNRVILEVVGGLSYGMKTFGEIIPVKGINSESDDYPNFVSWIKKENRWDFGIIPLEPTDFNSKKSYIKFLDYSALGLASICSDIEPYREVVEEGRNGILVSNDTESWYKAIKRLIEDTDLRSRLAENAFHDLTQKYILETNAENYLRLYQEILWASRKSSDANRTEFLEFDEENYLTYNPDVAEAIKEGRFLSAFHHWEVCGRKEMDSGLRSYRPRIIADYSSGSSSIPYTRQQLRKKIEQWSLQPLISIIMPVYNVDKIWLDKAVQSVKNQIYPYWELCIADDYSTNQETINYLKHLQSDSIRIKFLNKNQGISVASNEAWLLAQGEYIALLDNDDELAEDALYEVAKAINEHQPDLIYSDEDKITLEGGLVEPHFKPDYSPDTILSQNYISHLSVYRKFIVEEIGGFREGFEGSQDYDLLLRFLEKSEKVYHIPRVLYHWRKVPGSTADRFHSKSYAWEAGKKALQETMKRRKIKAQVQLGKYPGTYRVRREILGNPLVSIIIPFKDEPRLLKQCIDSVLFKSTYDNFEIIGISNSSVEKETFSIMEDYQNQDKRIFFKEYNHPFNFSAINNYAVTFANGEHIVLLNNDIEIISSEWIEALLEHSQRPEIGAVGGKLYFPNETIQHAGVIIGVGGIAGHSHKYLPRETNGYFCRPNIIGNICAVTAACLMVKKYVFQEVKGLDYKNLSIAFNDIDFCLRLIEAGYLNIYTPYCEAYHHESVSRGYEDTPKKQARFRNEVNYMKKRHKEILLQGDPYYNPSLTLESEDFSFRENEYRAPLEIHLK